MLWQDRFLSLFRMAILDTGWLLPTTLLLIGGTFVAFRIQRPDEPAELVPLPLLLLFLVPFASLLLASLTYGFGKAPNARRWPSIVLSLLPLLHLAVLTWLVRRYRRWLLLPLAMSALSLVWVGLSWFIGAMAIADDWI